MEEVKVEAKDNDILSEVNDSFLRRKKKKNIIIFSIISAAVILLSALIITFSAIKVNTKPTTISEPTKFDITISGKTTSLDPTDENYDEFYNNFKSSFDISYLTALFTNSLKEYEISETTDSFYSSYSNNVGSGKSSTLSNYLGDDYIHLYYSSEQKICKPNGDVYYSKRNTSKYELKYVDVYFPISSTNLFEEHTFYFGTFGYSSPRITTISVNANTNNLYKFVKGL